MTNESELAIAMKEKLRLKLEELAASFNARNHLGQTWKVVPDKNILGGTVLSNRLYLLPAHRVWIDQGIIHWKICTATKEKSGTCQSLEEAIAILAFNAGKDFALKYYQF